MPLMRGGKAQVRGRAVGRTHDQRTSSEAWQCRVCGRRFAKINQWHSCKPQSIDSHFVGKSREVRDLFELLIAKLKKAGPLHIDAVKSSINLVSRHHFGGVIVRRDYLRVGFLAKSRIKSPRVVRTEVIGPNRVGHSVVIRQVADIDEQLLSWLAGAQKLQA